MKTFQRLENLPPEVLFSFSFDPLRKRIRYNNRKQLLIFKGVMRREDRDSLLRLSTDPQYQEAVRGLFVNSQLENLEGELTKYGEIFVESPDIWHSTRLFKYKKTRDEDIEKMRNIDMWGLQGTVKETSDSSVEGSVNTGKLPSETDTQPPEQKKNNDATSSPQASQKMGGDLNLTPQELFRTMNTFLAEVGLQKLVEGRDDKTLLKGYEIYLFRFLVTVIPGKRYRLLPFWRTFDSRNTYGEVSIRIGCPTTEDLVETGIEVSVRLKGLPQGVSPNDLSRVSSKTRYDAETELLIHRGIMTKEEKVGLLKLANDTTYQKAVERLYERSGADGLEKMLEKIKSERKPYIYNFIPQEYAQHLEERSTCARSFGLNLSYGLAGAQKPVSASLRNAYTAECAAILSNQTLIGFMRGDEEVGWLFGPRVVGLTPLGRFDRRVPEKGVRQVYALVAIPGELPMVKLTINTNWVNIRDHTKRAFSHSKVCELLEQHRRFRNEAETVMDEVNEDGLLHIGLEALPPNIHPNDLNRYNTRYDAGTRLLIHRGIMTEEEKDGLLGLATNNAYREAVGRLFRVSQEDGLLSIVLGALPSNIHPGDLNRYNTRYNTETRLLIHRGIMTEEERNGLLGLADDRAYQRAVELLFRISEIQRRRIDWEATVTRNQNLDSRVNRLESLMPVRTSCSLLPYNPEKETRSHEDNLLYLRPKINALLPSPGPCSKKTQVLIKGRNFDFQSWVEVDGEVLPPSSLTLINRETLLATISPREGKQEGTVQIRVITSFGISNEIQFSYTGTTNNQQTRQSGSPNPTQPIG